MWPTGPTPSGHRTLATAAVKGGIEALGSVQNALSPQAFAARVNEAFKRFGALIKERSIRPDCTVLVES